MPRRLALQCLAGCAPSQIALALGRNPWQMVFVRCSFVMRTPFPFLCIKSGLLLTQHRALPAEKAFTGTVPDVHELTMCGAGETDDERPDAHIFVVGV